MASSTFFPRRPLGSPLAWVKSLVIIASFLAFVQFALPHVMAPKSITLLAALAVFGDTTESSGGAVVAAGDIDLGWHAPAQSEVNNLTAVINSKGVWGFIYDTSATPDDKYGQYNWCNMPHVRKTEYLQPADEYELKYVELVHRHHKRTPYASNAFPVEPYQWNCDEQGLFYYGEPFSSRNKPAKTYWKVYISPVNPFVPAGWIGTCQFPQITAQGLDDSWLHGADLYGVYHDLLGFLPPRDAVNSPEWHRKVKYRVTNNQITSQVAGMVVNGMWATTDSLQLSIQAAGVDSLEPQYSCPAGASLFNRIKSASNAAWAQHLAAAGPLYKALDDISGVPADDGGFHASLDHYYDNLSARQCHDKPFPCKLVDGVNSTTCVTQDLADAAYRLGHWEYSQIYRDAPDSLAASAATWGVWIAELATHIRAVIKGESETIYFHNVAHDGSVSRLLSILQLDHMVWPGMGSEVVFELYKKKAVDGGNPPSPAMTSVVVAPGCSRNNCLRQMIRESASAAIFCPSLTAAASWNEPLPTWAANCNGNAAAMSSACSCIDATATATTAVTATATAGESGWYVRVLWSGQVFKSSNPALGLMDMIPVETLLAYFDGLVGENANLVKGRCSA
ncbi:Counting factor 60 [Colletotrichum tanaceti]|uniref:Counting factor 60 n=1 Tax=Colletotrichum tanaceti TaxID=1306861 RepID=A0A4U6XMF0_9PEZI|nr:Counting factor 60 [Colletotrichum tanaceti]TKW56857.1 Counting factor 60 [Colletotrichum tanaceti]